eukprot:gene3028-852_t
MDAQSLPPGPDGVELFFLGPRPLPPGPAGAAAPSAGVEADDADDVVVDVVVEVTPTGFIPGSVQFNPRLEAIPWTLIMEERHHKHIRDKEDTIGEELHVIDFWINKIAESRKLQMAKQTGAQAWRVREAMGTIVSYLPTLSTIFREEERMHGTVAGNDQQEGDF